MGRVSLGLLFSAFAAVAAGQQIQFAEPVDIAVEGSAAQFDAYGRRFSLTLSDNERVLSRLSGPRKQQLQGYRLRRGALDGQPGSWVRLTESANGVEGAIWDGRDLYAVTTLRQIAPYLTTPMDAAPDQTVVYRLSDARDLLPRDFCGLHGESTGLRKQTALDQYQAMVANLGDVIEARITRQIEISLLADSRFAEDYADPTAAMVARLNIVEGIYSEQVGLLILATDLRVMVANEDPFASTQGATLLEQLGKYRASTAAVKARGIAHLMTGKNLDGTTAGLAYVDSVCSAERGVSLSEQGHGATISALIMAHELGHNLGAPHDGEAGACSAVTGGFIMSPSVSGFSTFSQCSINVMQSRLETASCVTPADYADVTLSPAASPVAAEAGLGFALPFTVRSTGTAPAEDAVFTVSFPEGAGVTPESASAEGGSCAVAGVTANCSFGDLPPGEQRAVSITARGLLAGTVTAKGRVSAANDRLTSNNARDVTINLRSGVDAAVTLGTDATEVALNAPLQVFADVGSLRTLPVRNAVLSLNLNQSVTSASMPGASCAVNAYSVICNIAELPAGTASRLTVLAQTSAAGPLVASASISASGDGDLSNNSANARGWVQAGRDIELTAGPASVDLAVGAAYEVPLLVRSRGFQATGEVTLAVSLVSTAVSVEILDAEGTPCGAPNGGSFKCLMGLLAPGESRLVRVRVLGSRAASPVLNAVAEVADDGYTPNNSASVQLRIDNPIDLALVLASGGTGIEDQEFEGQVSVNSGGRQSAMGGTLDVQIPAEGRLLAASIHHGAACELLSPQLARCALPTMPRGAQVYVDYRATFADPGTYEVKFSLQTPGDTAAANDVLTRPILVRPFNDIAVSGDIDLTRWLVGTRREARFTLTAGPRALVSARFLARHLLPGVRVAEIRADGGTCQVDDTGGVCDFSNLAAASTNHVTVSWLAEAGITGSLAVSVSTAGDVQAANNTASGRVEALGATDIELRVAAAASGATGSTLDFPAISVVNGSEKAIDTRLEVTLPAEVKLVNVSAANAICTGTATLHCDFAELAANSTSTVNISVRASARGNYTSSLKLTALNDTNPANDSRQVAFEISGSSGVAASTHGGGGGGGTFEWLSLVLLGLFAARRLPALHK